VPLIEIKNIIISDSNFRGETRAKGLAKMAGNLSRVFVNRKRTITTNDSTNLLASNTWRHRQEMDTNCLRLHFNTLIYFK